jgi:glutathione peroxidase
MGKKPMKSMINAQDVRMAARWLALVFSLACLGVAAKDCPPLLNHKLAGIKGAPVDFCTFKGKVVLVVNTASQCGFTPQYEGLQALHERFSASGLVVVGFPANDFGAQEPGSNADVAEFCERKFNVKFTMMEKSSVVGAKANPLFRTLAKESGDVPKWNFHKYLIDRDGKLVASYGSRIAPQSTDMVGAIERALQVK